MDLDFLDVELPPLAKRRDLVNVFDVFGLSGSERAADETLAYFLDPSERHGMGSAFVDALLSLLSGGPVLDDRGRPHDAFQEGAFVGSSEWSVGAQVPVTAPETAHSALSWAGIMDLYLTNDALGIAVIIENKIGAPLNNPLESYVRHAVAQGYSTVLLAVLAPYRHTLDDEHTRWATAAITYPAMFERLRETFAFADHPLSDSSLDVRRSLDLLQQFQEIRERSAATMGYSSEAEFVNGFRQMLSGRETAVDEFFNAVKQVNRLVRERSRRLEPLIRERLHTDGVETGWEAHGESTQRWVYAWNAYHLVDSDNSIELIMTPDPSRAGPITVKAYPGRTYKNYPDFDHITCGVDWQSSDEEVADAFLGVLARLLQDHPRGS